MLDGTETGTEVTGVIDFAVAESARILRGLRSVRAASDVITTASDRLHSLLEQIEAAGAGSESSGLLADARKSVQDSAGDLKDLNAQDLIEHLNSAMRHMKELKFIAMMIKIETAGPAYSGMKAGAFANDLEALVGTLDEATKTARERVDPIQGRISEAYKALQDTALGLTLQVDKMADLAGCTADLKQARDGQMTALGQEARQVSSYTALQISRLVPRLQFADAFVQRVQNTQRFIEGAGQNPETPMEHVLAVASQQMKRLREDTRVERDASTEALEALYVATSQSAKVLTENDTSDDFGRWLQASATAIEMNTQVIEASRLQLLSAFQHIEEAFVVADKVGDTISKFLPLAQTLKFTAINGSLMAAHSSSKQSASDVLTAEIQSVGKKCGEKMTASAAALVNINDILSHVDRSGLEEQIKLLAGSLKKAEVAQVSLQNLTHELSETRLHLSEGVTALMVSCRDARRTIEEGEAMVHGLETLIDTGGASDLDRIQADGIQWIIPYYTTEPERSLHQQLFGGGLDPVEETFDLDDDLDDFLL